MPVPKSAFRYEKWLRKISDASRKRSSQIARSRRGQRLSKETRQKISEAKSGRKHHMFGKHHSKKTRERISNSRMGAVLSDETRQKISEAMSGERNPNFGKSAAKGSGIGKGSYSKKGHWVRSSWERVFADWLLDQGIEYDYEPFRFNLGSYKGKNLNFTPDFYLPHTDTFVEIKGFTRDYDLEKWRRFISTGAYLVILDQWAWERFREQCLGGKGGKTCQTSPLTQPAIPTQTVQEDPSLRPCAGQFSTGAKSSWAGVQGKGGRSRRLEVHPIPSDPLLSSPNSGW